MATDAKRDIAVRGAGVVGLWQALTLARRGHEVTLFERSGMPFTAASSRYAGAMLAPFCEEEGASPLIRDLGLRGLALWRDLYPGLVQNGSLVVALPRDRAELERFGRMTQGHRMLGREEIAALEPDLGGRFGAALLYSDEAHVAPEPVLRFLLDRAREAGVELRFGAPGGGEEADLVIDATGIAARAQLVGLRGVRGERAVIRTREVRLSRPVRLLHPRFPVYVVPWGDGLYMVGATVIESDDAGPVTVRSALDLLATAYALHPAFGEAEILEFGAGVRPAFPDNEPRIVIDGRTLYVNGLYRHGFLLAPVLAEVAADHIETGATPGGLFRCASG